MNQCVGVERPLPRSLAPLPEETVPGFLLRLAHRLDITPSQVAARTGLLAPDGYIPPRFILHIPDATAARFARLTQLSRVEVDALCLSSLKDRYPPLDLDYSRLGAAGPNKGATFSNYASWLFPRSTRYCPRCLKGDGSPIQNQFGGTWRKSWWLAPVFACPIHHIMLETHCPTCRQHLHPPTAGRGASDAVMHSHHPRHPAQCRAHRTVRNDTSPGCLASLADAVHTPASPELQALQNRILTTLHLSPHHRSSAVVTDTEQRNAARYFNDLFLLVALVRTSWPEARLQAPTWINSDQLDHYHRDLARRNARTPIDAAVRAGLPIDPDSCAQLLALSERLHPAATTSNPDRLTAMLLRAERRPAWTRLVRSLAPNCSIPLQEAAAPLLHAGPQRHRRPATTRPRRREFSFDHKNVSHFLAEPHIQPLLDIVGDSIKSRTVHRFAAVRIVTAVEACSLPTASSLLGLPPDWGNRANRSVMRWAHCHHVSDGVRRAVDHIIDRIDADSTRINYQQRRNALAEWSISPDHWAAIKTDLTPLLTSQTQDLSLPDELTHHIASIIVWSIVTQGDPQTAPLLRCSTGRRNLALAKKVTATLALLTQTTTGTGPIPGGVLADYSHGIANAIDHHGTYDDVHNPL